jgi:hypothetical protein
MAITNGLCSLSDVKSAMNIFDSTDDSRLELAVEAASRMIEADCNRRFYQDAGVSARIFSALSGVLVLTDDISTVTGLIVKTDTGFDGTFDQTWTSADYQLEPLNGIVDGQAWPYTQIRAVESLTFPYSRTRAVVQVTARWGWAAVPTAVKQAAIIQSISVFKSVEAPFGALGLPDTGILRIRSGLHPSAAMLVAPYRRDAVLVA